MKRLHLIAIVLDQTFQNLLLPQVYSDLEFVEHSQIFGPIWEQVVCQPTHLILSCNIHELEPL